MKATATCRTCGSEFSYEASDSPMLRDFAPSICGACVQGDVNACNEALATRERASRGLPPRYRDATFESFTSRTPSQELALAALRDRALEGVMLIGGAGCGKTHLACAAISAGPAGSLFVNTTALLDDVRRGYGGEGQGLYVQALWTPLLALDDLGSEAVTDWVRDRLYTLINGRWDQCLPLIVTTNVTAADLAERIGQGVASRIAGCCAHRISVKGPDVRRGHGRGEVRPWTTSEEDALRHLAHLGTRALAEAFERPARSIEGKARQLGLSLRRRGPEDNVSAACSEAGLRRACELMAAPLCPACSKRPAGVRRTGFCWSCHLEALRLVHEEEIARLDGQRALWAARSKLHRRRRSASATVESLPG